MLCIEIWDGPFIDKMSETKVEYRSLIKFLTKEGNGPKTIHERMVAVYGEDTPSYFQVNIGLNSFDGAESQSMMTQSPDDPLKLELKTLCEKSKIWYWKIGV